jgi:hypothetical protein
VIRYLRSFSLLLGQFLLCYLIYRLLLLLFLDGVEFILVVVFIELQGFERLVEEI